MRLFKKDQPNRHGVPTSKCKTTELRMTASQDSRGENESEPRDAGSGECFEETHRGCPRNSARHRCGHRHRLAFLYTRVSLRPSEGNTILVPLPPNQPAPTNPPFCSTHSEHDAESLRLLHVHWLLLHACTWGSLECWLS